MPSCSLWICSTLGGVLFVSILLNAALLYKALHYYTRAKTAEVFLGHQHQFAETNANLPQKAQKRIILFGNSRAAEWAPLPEINGIEFINRGIGGETSAQNRLRFQSDVLALQPDIVILQQGINDLTLLGVRPEWSETVIQHYQTNIKFMLDTLLAQDIDVIFLTIIPPAAPDLARRLVWHTTIQQAVTKINQYWLRLPPTQHLYIVDAQSVLQDSNGHWHPNVNRDTLHLTPEGYRYLNQAILPILAKL